VNIPPHTPRLALIDRSQFLLHSIDVERLIDDDHSARSIWHLVGRLNLSKYYAEIAAVEGRAGRDHTAPQLLISLWLYAYSEGISSAREIARRSEFEPGLQWLCGLQPISHRTLSGFRSEYKQALDDLFVQVVGMLSAEGLITMQRVTLDGTKIKANASGNTFRRKEKLEAHLALAREHVAAINAQAAEERAWRTGELLRDAAPHGKGRVGLRQLCVRWSGCKTRSGTTAISMSPRLRLLIRRLM
jgi:transposase